MDNEQKTLISTMDKAARLHDLPAYSDLTAALKVFVDKHQSAPDGPLGLGLVNGDFFKAKELLERISNAG